MNSVYLRDLKTKIWVLDENSKKIYSAKPLQAIIEWHKRDNSLYSVITKYLIAPIDDSKNTKIVDEMETFPSYDEAIAALGNLYNE